MAKTKFIYPAIILLYCSCYKGEKNSPVSTPYFDSVIVKAERISDSGYKTNSLAYIISEHAHSKNLTVMDEMNYFAYCAELFRKDFKDYDKYMAYADSMLSTLEKNNQKAILPYRYVQAYNMKADALFAKGLYPESYDYYYQAKKLAKETGDTCSLSQYSYSLGMVLYRQQRFLEAASHFIESYNESSECKDKFIFFYHRQEVLDNIGLCYFNMQKYDSAMLFYKRTLAYIDSNYMRYDKRESAYISAKAVVYGNMASVYVALNNYDTAKVLLEKSININLQKGYTNTDAIISQATLAKLYFDKGNLEEMKDVLQKIKVELDTIPDNDKRVDRMWNKLMWQYYDHEKDSVKAYRYLLAYQIMNDSLIARNKSLMAADVEGRIRSIERTNHINQLKKNNEQERIYLIIAVIIMFMAVIIIGLILRNAQKAKKNLELLTSLNNQVNEQKEKLQIAITELEWKDKDKSRILRSVAHDVMNPIAAIMAFIDILLTGPERYTDEQREIFNLIKEACNNSLNLSKDILEASVDHTGLTKEWVDINKLVASSVELLSFRAIAKKQCLMVTGDDKNVQAFVNKEKIWRVINNLIGNAIKFSHENSDITINILSSSGKVDISVKDNGIGIPEKNKPYVFDMFTEAKVPGTSGEAPHGLGLSISLQIAKAHYGTIWFESIEGKGSTFHLVLPLNTPV